MESKCKYCKKRIQRGDGFLKDRCRKCYEKIRYYQNENIRVQNTGKKRKNKQSNEYFYNRLKSNPEEKKMLLIRQMTYHKYGKAKICSNCQTTKNVNHHHFKPYSVDNFVDLCSLCHKRKHWKEFDEKNLEAKA